MCTKDCDDQGSFVASAVDVAKLSVELIESELKLARQSLRNLVLTALLLPIVVSALWLSVIALLVSALHHCGLNWPAAWGSGTLFQAIILFAMLRGARRRMSDLTLPRSRNALSGVLDLLP